MGFARDGSNSRKTDNLKQSMQNPGFELSKPGPQARKIPLNQSSTNLIEFPRI